MESNYNCASCNRQVPLSNKMIHDVRCSSSSKQFVKSIQTVTAKQDANEKRSKLNFDSLLSGFVTDGVSVVNQPSKRIKTHQQSSWVLPNSSSLSSSAFSSSNNDHSNFNPNRCAPLSSGWVCRSPGMEMMDYALSNLPSTFSALTVAWISLDKEPRGSSSNTEDMAHIGKWMWFVYESEVDEKFILLADALDKGLLGHCIKVPPVSAEQKFFENNSDSNRMASSDMNKSGSSTSSHDSASRSDGLNSSSLEPRAGVVPFIVYTKDFRDRVDVLRVGLELRKLIGYSKTISYKPDVFTGSVEGIYGSGKIPTTIYSLKKGSDELTLTKHNKEKTAYDLALEMVSRGSY